MTPFELAWVPAAREQFEELKAAAMASLSNREKGTGKKPGKSEGLFKQVHSCLIKLQINPRHPGLRTHKFSSMPHPYDPKKSVFEAYAQNDTPGAYRVFWCYGLDKTQITILAITPHP